MKKKQMITTIDGLVSQVTRLEGQCEKLETRLKQLECTHKWEYETESFPFSLFGPTCSYRKKCKLCGMMCSITKKQYDEEKVKEARAAIVSAEKEIKAHTPVKKSTKRSK